MIVNMQNVSYAIILIFYIAPLFSYCTLILVSQNKIISKSTTIQCMDIFYCGLCKTLGSFVVNKVGF